MEIILLAEEIPNFAQVSKPNGSTMYELRRDEVKVYWSGNIKDADIPKPVIPPVNGVILIGERSLTVVDGKYKLKWNISERELLEWLQERDDERNSK